MATVPAPVSPHAGLLDWLAGRHIEYELHEHPETFTAEATARAEHVDPRQFAKVVGVITAEGRTALVMVDAVDHVDLAKARRVLGSADVRILTETEFTALAPDCDPGTVPPVPTLYSIPVYADFAIRDDAMISFAAGSHRYTVHVDRAAFEKAAGLAYADLAQERDVPAWAR